MKQNLKVHITCYETSIISYDKVNDTFRTILTDLFT